MGSLSGIIVGRHPASVNPGTPAGAVSAAAEVADLVLCMSVNPGWGGQAFIASSPDKLRLLRAEAPEALLEVDGGRCV